jgi:hypothetical protein
MQILIKRSQRAGGMLGGKVIFTLGIRAQYTDEERANINKYNLGGEIIYDSKAAQQYQQQAAGATSLIKGLGYLALSKMNLAVSIASLQRGHSIECPNLAELLECEDALVSACKNVKTFLEAASSFDGREIVVDLDEQMAG